jgi:hypothetical protein
VKVRAWVEISEEREIDLSLEDVTSALAEAFARVTDEQDAKPARSDVLMAINRIGTFLKALTDEQLGQMNVAQLRTIGEFLDTQSARYRAMRERKEAGAQ